jgi:hypothetical protein
MALFTDGPKAEARQGTHGGWAPPSRRGEDISKNSVGGPGTVLFSEFRDWNPRYGWLPLRTCWRSTLI